jgi:hypothetical protein
MKRYPTTGTNSSKERRDQRLAQAGADVLENELGVHEVELNVILTKVICQPGFNIRELGSHGITVGLRQHRRRHVHAEYLIDSHRSEGEDETSCPTAEIQHAADRSICGHILIEKVEHLADVATARVEELRASVVIQSVPAVLR